MNITLAFSTSTAAVILFNARVSGMTVWPSGDSIIGTSDWFWVRLSRLISCLEVNIKLLLLLVIVGGVRSCGAKIKFSAVISSGVAFKIRIVCSLPSILLRWIIADPSVIVKSSKLLILVKSERSIFSFWLEYSKSVMVTWSSLLLEDIMKVSSPEPPVTVSLPSPEEIISLYQCL